jgi:predicted DNA-binding transcriptional regulator AlpA
MENRVKYLNEKETSNLTSLALSTLRNHRSKGCGLPYIKIGRAVRYSFQDIIDYFEGHKVQQTGPK